MITLRPYQSDDIAKILDSLDAGHHPVCAVATGGGKSVYIAELCRRLDGRILVVTHRKELIQQNEAGFLRHGGDDVGVYSAGLERRDTDARVMFAGVQSIYKRMEELQSAGGFRYVIWDECHFSLGRKSEPSMATAILNACPDAQRIGMSATPYRLDMGPIWGDEDCWFDDLACERGISELTDLGYLSPLVGVSAASAPNLDHVRSRAGDYVLSELSQASSEESVVEAACDEIVYLAPDRQSILVFAVDRAHARIVSDALTARDVENDIVLGTTDERAEITESFKAGELRCIVNVGVLTTGFDAPRIDCVALMRATQSKGLCVQMIGRGCRLYPGKLDCLVLDLGGNLHRHRPLDGVPRIMRSPQLAEKEKQEQRQREQAERERKARHGECAARGIDPLGTIRHEDVVRFRVKGCSFFLRPAKKFPERLNLVASYKCVDQYGGSRSVNQFVLWQYPGRPGQEAAAWFERRGMSLPTTGRQALAMAYRAPMPSEIVVEKRDGWDRVVMEYFE